MKTLLLIFLTLLLIESQAKVLTVSNRNGASAQYKSVPEAIAAAAAGDTIYINGSETSYGTITIDKKLTLIGTGHNPQKEIGLVSVLDIIHIGTDISEVANASSLIGLKVGQVFASNTYQKNIIIKRCDVLNIYANASQGTSAGGFNTDWIIENNILGNVSLHDDKSASYNFIIRNNIILGQLVYAHNSLITNNNFISQAIVGFFDTHNSIIQNNIFYNTSPAGANNSTFNNNISYHDLTWTDPNTAIPYGSNSGNKNIVDKDPLFIKFSGTTSNNSNGIDYENDYRLQVSSPGKNAGTDGTDIGIYGGMGFSETGEPPIPIIRAFTIKNGVVAPKGKLQISIKAEAKN